MENRHLLIHHDTILLGVARAATEILWTQTLWRAAHREISDERGWELQSQFTPEIISCRINANSENCTKERNASSSKGWQTHCFSQSRKLQVGKRSHLILRYKFFYFIHFDINTSSKNTQTSLFVFEKFEKLEALPILSKSAMSQTQESQIKVSCFAQLNYP